MAFAKFAVREAGRAGAVVQRAAPRSWFFALSGAPARTRSPSIDRLSHACSMPNLGINMPDMGMTGKRISEAAALYARANLSDALFSTTQQRVLGCLFGNPERSFTISELKQITGAGSGAVQREVARLAGSGLLALEQIGNQKHYRANPDCPI